MTIGIDLTVLQTDHRKRGIGATAINIINNLPEHARQNYQFIFFIDPLKEDPLPLLKLENIHYEVRTARMPLPLQYGRLPRRILVVLNALKKLLDMQLSLLLGDRRLESLTGVNYFLQFNQGEPLPKKYGLKKIVIAYDIIPYVMEYDYLPGYRASRIQGRSRKRSLANTVKRYLYKNQTKKILKSATTIVAISSHTKKDLVDRFNINGSKIRVAYLGVNPLVTNTETSPKLHKLTRGSWGHKKVAIKLSPESYLLFVGGVDPRRKVTELVAAFNNLRAQGNDIKLVLAGDTMYNADEVANEDLRNYLKNTSYLDDIYFMGFIDNNQRDWLYKNALAFVYPSTYEGFGLPILEAMRYGTPVITYKNSSIGEVAGDAALYANSFEQIVSLSKSLIDGQSFRESYRKKGMNQAQKFQWDKTAKYILEIISDK